ncbi:hypothetical protein EVAR_61207_1 [Eumeta japonica]|uniref:Uncharacterized protein n=1 Tax=Eumeta variegata TaxID=151549 RepID=A0A4C1YY23_EUMVA|nr:hypothetical protein EVAR_61207_1 [Eumeta japonica]
MMNSIKASRLRCRLRRRLRSAGLFAARSVRGRVSTQYTERSRNKYFRSADEGHYQRFTSGTPLMTRHLRKVRTGRAPCTTSPNVWIRSERRIPTPRNDFLMCIRV